MEALLVIAALFALLAFPIAVLVNLATLRGSVERTNQLLSRVSSDLADVRRDIWRAEKKSHAGNAESAEVESHAESAKSAEFESHAENAEAKSHAESAESAESDSHAERAENAEPRSGGSGAVSPLVGHLAAP